MGEFDDLLAGLDRLIAAHDSCPSASARIDLVQAIFKMTQKLAATDPTQGK